MPIVTVHEGETAAEKSPAADTPSQAVVKAATMPQTVTDTQGRTLGVKKLGALDRLKMFEVVGADNAKNEAYLGYAALAFHVTSIDGDPIGRPANRMQLESLVQRLGDDGLEAVGAALQATMPQESDADAIKN